jgi:hypothetical protein
MDVELNLPNLTQSIRSFTRVTFEAVIKRMDGPHMPRDFYVRYTWSADDKKADKRYGCAWEGFATLEECLLDFVRSGTSATEGARTYRAQHGRDACQMAVCESGLSKARSSARWSRMN